MSVTVNNLIELLDTEENRYGGATGKPRELNISINGNFRGSIESAKLDGHGDGLVTDVTLEIEVPKMKEYYEQEIRNKAIDEFTEKLSDRLTELSDNATIYGVKNVDFLTLDTVIEEIGDMAEQLKEVGE